MTKLRKLGFVGALVLATIGVGPSPASAYYSNAYGVGTWTATASDNWPGWYHRVRAYCYNSFNPIYGPWVFPGVPSKATCTTGLVSRADVMVTRG